MSKSEDQTKLSTATATKLGATTVSTVGGIQWSGVMGSFENIRENLEGTLWWVKKNNILYQNFATIGLLFDSGGDGRYDGRYYLCDGKCCQHGYCVRCHSPLSADLLHLPRDRRPLKIPQCVTDTTSSRSCFHFFGSSYGWNTKDGIFLYQLVPEADFELIKQLGEESCDWCHTMALCRKSIFVGTADAIYRQSVFAGIDCLLCKIWVVTSIEYVAFKFLLCYQVGHSCRVFHFNGLSILLKMICPWLSSINTSFSKTKLNNYFEIYSLFTCSISPTNKQISQHFTHTSQGEVWMSGTPRRYGR